MCAAPTDFQKDMTFKVTLLLIISSLVFSRRLTVSWYSRKNGVSYIGNYSSDWEI